MKGGLVLSVTFACDPVYSHLWCQEVSTDFGEEGWGRGLIDSRYCWSFLWSRCDRRPSAIRHRSRWNFFLRHLTGTSCWRWNDRIPLNLARLTLGLMIDDYLTVRLSICGVCSGLFGYTLITSTITSDTHYLVNFIWWFGLLTWCTSTHF